MPCRSVNQIALYVYVRGEYCNKESLEHERETKAEMVMSARAMDRPGWGESEAIIEPVHAQDQCKETKN
jgi:hypothetical protein